MTLSCADLRWNELVSIVIKLSGKSISDADIESLSYFERCEILNTRILVLLAKHFQYRVEVFFKQIVIDGPLGQDNYYAIRVEFELRGSSHIHSFIWVINAPTLSMETKDEYILFVDKIIKASISEPYKKAEVTQNGENVSTSLTL